MPKSKSTKKPDIHQLMGIMAAKATGTDVPFGAREFEHLVKKAPKKRAKKK